MKPNSRPLTIAVGLCLVFMMLMTPPSVVRGADTPPQSGGETHVFPTFGVQLTLPTGWWPVQPYTHRHVATLQKVEEQTNAPLAEILLEVLGEESWWFAALDRGPDGWVLDFQDSCGAPEDARE